jgi:hypothetical protein
VVSERVQSMHLHVLEGEDTGPMLSVQLGTCKKLIAQCSCPVEAWNAIMPLINGKSNKPDVQFAKLFGLSHAKVFERLVVRSPSQQAAHHPLGNLLQTRIDPTI